MLKDRLSRNKRLAVSQMAFRTRKVFGTFEKRAPGTQAPVNYHIDLLVDDLTAEPYELHEHAFQSSASLDFFHASLHLLNVLNFALYP